MSLTDIKARIEADARAEAAEILAAAKSTVMAVQKETEDEVRSLADAQRARLDSEIPEILRRREIVAKLDVKREDLKARRELIDEAFEASKTKMAEMEEDVVKRFVEVLLGQAVETKDETLFVGKGEKFLDGSWLNAYNEKNGSNLKLSGEKAPIVGGFILRRGLVDVNCSWEMLIRAAREDLEAETVTRLFAN